MLRTGRAPTAKNVAGPGHGAVRRLFRTRSPRASVRLSMMPSASTQRRRRVRSPNRERPASSSRTTTSPYGRFGSLHRGIPGFCRPARGHEGEVHEIAGVRGVVQPPVGVREQLLPRCRMSGRVRPPGTARGRRRSATGVLRERSRTSPVRRPRGGTSECRTCHGGRPGSVRSRR